MCFGARSWLAPLSSKSNQMEKSYSTFFKFANFQLGFTGEPSRKSKKCFMHQSFYFYMLFDESGNFSKKENFENHKLGIFTEF